MLWCNFLYCSLGLLFQLCFCPLSSFQYFHYSLEWYFWLNLFLHFTFFSLSGLSFFLAASSWSQLSESSIISYSHLQCDIMRQSHLQNHLRSFLMLLFHRVKSSRMWKAWQFWPPTSWKMLRNWREPEWKAIKVLVRRNTEERLKSWARCIWWRGTSEHASEHLMKRRSKAVEHQPMISWSRATMTSEPNSSLWW